MAPRSDANNKQPMKLKTQKKTPLLKEGGYEAKVASIKAVPDDSDPKKIVLGFKVVDHPEEIPFEAAANLSAGKPLRKSVETLLNRALKDEEADELDLDALAGVEANIVVAHKGGAGGRPVPYVSVILPKPTDNKAVQG
jgi:hypothetical protein